MPEKSRLQVKHTHTQIFNLFQPDQLMRLFHQVKPGISPGIRKFQEMRQPAVLFKRASQSKPKHWRILNSGGHFEPCWLHM